MFDALAIDREMSLKGDRMLEPHTEGRAVGSTVWLVHSILDRHLDRQAEYIEKLITATTKI
jgi:hypothetical protein